MPEPALFYPVAMNREDFILQNYYYENLASTAPFTTEVRSTILTLMYHNDGFIGDFVFPRVQTESEKFDFAAMRGEEYVPTPTEIGRTGLPNRITAGFDMIGSNVRDYAIEMPIPKRDASSAKDSHIPYSPSDHAIDLTTEKILLDRERRIADLARATSSYMTAGGTGFDLTGQTNLAAADRWSNYASTTADPLKLINGIRAKMLLPANLLVMNWEKWITLAQNPKLVSAMNGADSGTYGMITPEWFEKTLSIGIQAPIKLVFGGCWVNTLNPDIIQSINMAGMGRIWGNDVLLLHVKNLASVRQNGSWGFTAQWKNRVSFQYPDMTVGTEGAMIQKTGEYVREIVADTKLGFLIQNAFS